MDDEQKIRIAAFEDFRRRLLEEGAYGAALEELGRTARESNDGFWPPLVHDILTIALESAADYTLNYLTALPAGEAEPEEESNG